MIDFTAKELTAFKTLLIKAIDQDQLGKLNLSLLEAQTLISRIKEYRLNKYLHL